MTYPYARIAHSVLRDASLSRRAKLVYCIGKLHLYGDWPSIAVPHARLAALSGCCVETVEEAVGELIARRLWDADSHDGQPNVYTYLNPTGDPAVLLDTGSTPYQFAPVPRAVLADADLGKWAKLVYAVGMVFLRRGGRTIYPSQAKLGEFCGMKSRESVARYSRELVERGLWRRGERGWSAVREVSYVDVNEVYGKERQVG